MGRINKDSAAKNEPHAIRGETVLKRTPLASRRPAHQGPKTAPPRPIPRTSPEPEPRIADGNTSEKRPKLPPITAKRENPAQAPIIIIDSNDVEKYGNNATEMALVKRAIIINILRGKNREKMAIAIDPNRPLILTMARTSVPSVLE